MTTENRRDMIDQLKFISSARHDYYKSLTTNRNDESLHPADKEDIIYIAGKLTASNILQQDCQHSFLWKIHY